MPIWARRYIGSPVDVRTVEQDVPSVRRSKADDAVKGRGLARAIGPQQADDLPRLDAGR